MIRTLRKLRGRSQAEFWIRGKQALCAGLERSRLAVFGVPRLRESDKFDEADCGGAFALAFAAPGAAREIALEIARFEPLVAKRCYDVVELLRAGIVPAFGSQRLAVGNPPNWHREARTGLVAPRVHWSRIPFLDPTVVGDHKVLWEPNRLQHLYSVAFCWLLDPEPDLLRLIERHLLSWIEDNPPRVGVNWASSLELAYRAIACCWLLALLRSAPLSSALIRKLVATLEVHGTQIERYLSTYFSPNTHLTGEGLGLFYLGSTFPRMRHAARWRSLGSRILHEQLEKQVRADGTYFEQATQYHRYTAEIYLHFFALAKATNWSTGASLQPALHALFDVLRLMADGRGHIPLIGDDDGGLLMPLDQRPPDDVSGLLLAGAVALARPELAPAQVRSRAYAYWLAGTSATEKLVSGPVVTPVWRSTYCAAGGLAVLRDDWSSTSGVAVIDAGPHGALNCGHAHADALSMTLTLGQVPLCVDRGTLTYVGPLRNEYRSTASHNTLEFDGESAARPMGSFHWMSIPRRSTARLYQSDRMLVFVGQACGHDWSSRPSMHTRSVIHLRNSAWVVGDNGVRDGCQSAVSRWQLDSRLTAHWQDERTVDVCDAGGRNVARFYLLFGRNLRIAGRAMSPSYGQESDAYVLEAEADSALNALMLVLPAEPEGRLPAVATTRDGATSVCHWVDRLGSHQLWGGGPTNSGPFGRWDIDADFCLYCEPAIIGARQESALTALLVIARPRHVLDPLGTSFGPVTAQPQLVVALSHQSDGAWSPHALAEPRWGEE